MNLEPVISEIETMYEGNPSSNEWGRFFVDEDDIEKWSAMMGCSNNQLYDALSLYLASGFSDGRLSFQFCDVIANQIQVIIYRSLKELPEIWDQVFVAFDSGEDTVGKDPSKDPVETHTRPAIAKILAKYGNSV